MQQHQTAHHPAPRRKKIDWAAKTMRIEIFILLLGATLIVCALILWLATSSVNKESDNLDKAKYQAVFLNGGVTSGAVSYSTYFGHVTTMNDKYVVLESVYYLTDQQGSNNQSNPQLTKLGCQQLHSPTDKMIINRSQVAFWENLQDSGKVVQAIQTFQKQNPNGPNCSANNTPATNTSPQGSTTTPTTNR
jgi:hypothetical protein